MKDSKIQLQLSVRDCLIISEALETANLQYTPNERATDAEIRRDTNRMLKLANLLGNKAAQRTQRKKAK